MRQIIFCFTGLYLWLSSAEGQIFRPGTEIGAFAGLSYYMGDINPRTHFYSPGISVGGLVKHNFTEHHCMRLNVFLGQLSGNDLEMSNEYQRMRGQSFTASVLDCHLGYEFNFMPYVINRWKKAHSPYIFAGFGYSLILSSSTGTAENHTTIPFGLGFKYRFNAKAAIGFEWGLRKTFVDNLDGVLNPGPDGSHAMSHNNDWYSFAGLYATFKIFEKGYECPGILKEEKKRK